MIQGRKIVQGFAVSLLNWILKLSCTYDFRVMVAVACNLTNSLFGDALLEIYCDISLIL